jgi:hypothetical protein
MQSVFVFHLRRHAIERFRLHDNKVASNQLWENNTFLFAIMSKWYCPYFNAYLLLKHTLKILGDFSGTHEQGGNFCTWRNENIIFGLWIVTFRTVLMEWSTFINQGIPVFLLWMWACSVLFLRNFNSLNNFISFKLLPCFVVCIFNWLALVNFQHC